MVKENDAVDCYKDFARIYDELVYDDIDYETWSQTIVDACNEVKVQFNDYLDLACGTGNLTQYIGRKFKSVWAVDLSYDMLMEADAKLRKQGLKPKCVCQNICELQLNQKFDLITCCLDSTNYILEEDELKSYFMKVHSHLNDDGMFVFDMNTYYKLTEVLGNNIYNYDDEKVVYIWQNVLDDEIVDMYLTFFVKEGELYRRFDEQHSEKAYGEKYIEDLLGQVGFKIMKKMNCYGDEPLNEKTERIAYFVMKQ